MDTPWHDETERLRSEAQQPFDWGSGPNERGPGQFRAGTLGHQTHEALMGTPITGLATTAVEKAIEGHPGEAAFYATVGALAGVSPIAARSLVRSNPGFFGKLWNAFLGSVSGSATTSRSTIPQAAGEAAARYRDLRGSLEARTNAQAAQNADLYRNRLGITRQMEAPTRGRSRRAQDQEDRVVAGVERDHPLPQQPQRPAFIDQDAQRLGRLEHNDTADLVRNYASLVEPTGKQQLAAGAGLLNGPFMGPELDMATDAAKHIASAIPRPEHPIQIEPTEQELWGDPKYRDDVGTADLIKRRAQSSALGTGYYGSAAIGPAALIAGILGRDPGTIATGAFSTLSASPYALKEGAKAKSEARTIEKMLEAGHRRDRPMPYRTPTESPEGTYE